MDKNISDQTLKNCPVCGSDYHEDISAWQQLALNQAQGAYKVYRCNSCKLRWLTPFGQGDSNIEIYDEDYYEAEFAEGCSYRDEKNQLVCCYENVVRGLKNNGISDRLLDIGCGTGDFLNVSKNNGIHCQGIEPSEYASQIAISRGHKVWQGTLDDFPYIENTFSAAHCSHVLEHVPDLHIFLEKLRTILEPGAPLYIEVPLQFDGILDRINSIAGRSRAFSTHSIHHHYFFNANSLRQALTQHGFNILSLTTHLPCRRQNRTQNFRTLALQSLLWTADKFANAGDVISVWARRQ